MARSPDTIEPNTISGRIDVEENRRSGCACGPVRPEFVSSELRQFLVPACGSLVCADPGEQLGGELREYVCHGFEQRGLVAGQFECQHVPYGGDGHYLQPVRTSLGHFARPV